MRSPGNLRYYILLNNLGLTAAVVRDKESGELWYYSVLNDLGLTAAVVRDEESGEPTVLHFAE